MLNDVIWRAFTRAKVPTMKERNDLPIDLRRHYTLVRRSLNGVGCDHTFSASYGHLTTPSAGVAAEKQFINKECK